MREKKDFLHSQGKIVIRRNRDQGKKRPVRPRGKLTSFSCFGGIPGGEWAGIRHHIQNWEKWACGTACALGGGEFSLLDQGRMPTGARRVKIRRVPVITRRG